MKPYLVVLISVLLASCATVAQEKIAKEVAQPVTTTIIETPITEVIDKEIPYHQIPEYPEKVTAGTSIGRTIDGLGYRYYWATKDLTEKDLNFEPGNEGQSAKNVLTHLYGLSEVIVNAPKGLPNIRPAKKVDWTWEERRKRTLQNFKAASDLFKASSDEEVAKMVMTFQRGENSNDVPVWNLLNGPLADAIYHTGQIVSFRRSTGNPMNPFVNVFMGKTKEN